MGAVKRRFLWMVILLIASASGAQQQRETAALPDFPVPPWPASGIIPAELAGKYVFVDVAKNEYVLAYPENLGTPAFEKDGPGALKIARYELQRNVEPTASVVVSVVNPTTYRYAYTVGNGAAAKQSIDQFSLAAPEQLGEVIKGPAGWFAIVQKGRTFKVRNPDWIKTGAAAVWSFEKPEAFIQPGSRKSGFELESGLKPGFTVGYFRKAPTVEIRVATSGFIPDLVKSQRDQLLALEYNSKTLLVIGPKFPRETDDRTIAADFLQGVTFLAGTKTLNPDSDFVKGLIAGLNRFLAEGPPINLTVQPRGEAETEIFNALKVSAKLN
jgi:hypothetical protein